MRIALLFVAVLASSACKKSPPVEDPGDLGLGSGSGSGSGTGTGTGTGTGAETSLPADMQTAIDGYVGALEAVADAADTATDCPMMATSIQAASEAGIPAMKAFDAFSKEEIESHNEVINAQFGARIDAASAKLGEAFERCEDDPAVQAEMAAIGF